MYSKILVPLDGSMLAEKALPYAIKLANTFQATLLLMRAVEVPTLTVDSPDTEREVINNAENYLKEIRATLTKPDSKLHLDTEKLQTLVVYGNPVEQLTALAPIEKVDLILMTTHGRSGVSRLVAGSVAGRVLHRSTVPVMLIRPTEVKSDQLLQEILRGVREPFSTCFEAQQCKVVLTLDGQPLSEKALDPAIELAQKLRATLHLLTVVFPAPPMLYGDLVGLGYNQTEIDQIDKKLVEDASKYLIRIQEKVSAKGVESVIAVRSGGSSDEIVAYALKIKASALVMATHARGETSHMFTGSIAEEVMRKSHLPVLMVSSHVPTEMMRDSQPELTASSKG
jgi:nucleotide-binding universal stress UspA family protein